eukprot:CAMPEP_0184011044 /NCGR_PEP_ID=MMETSP0954-20121128/3591_1 /TAXON_ID=627963 /ORGANISM="Aplanochytrium sp, Strain PBS07" /LENGTH=968 /DNA_ID=CAMNT_0026290783 /DNA_START=290 /DNA_END=3193 /DNA_ORIENTATION=-
MAIPESEIQIICNKILSQPTKEASNRSQNWRTLLRCYEGRRKEKTKNVKNVSPLGGRKDLKESKQENIVENLSKSHTPSHDAKGLEKLLISFYESADCSLSQEDHLKVTYIGSLLLKELDYDEDSARIGLHLIVGDILKPCRADATKDEKRELDGAVLRKVIKQYRGPLSCNQELTPYVLGKAVEWIDSMFSKVVQAGTAASIVDILFAIVLLKGYPDGLKWLYSVLISLLALDLDRLETCRKDTTFYQQLDRTAEIAKAKDAESIIGRSLDVFHGLKAVSVVEIQEYTERELEIERTICNPCVSPALFNKFNNTLSPSSLVDGVIVRAYHQNGSSLIGSSAADIWEQIELAHLKNKLQVSFSHDETTTEVLESCNNSVVSLERETSSDLTIDDTVEMKDASNSDESNSEKNCDVFSDSFDFEPSEEKCLVIKNATLRRPVPDGLDGFKHEYVDVMGDLLVTNYRIIFSSVTCSCKEFEKIPQHKNCPIKGRGLANGRQLYPLPFHNGLIRRSPEVILSLFSVRKIEELMESEVRITCKDLRRVRFQLPSRDHRKGFLDVCRPFCFCKVPESFAFSCRITEKGWKIFDVMRDYSRLGMLACERFRILKQSEKYEICPTYPKAIVVPASLSDKEVSSSCAFRSRKRIPVAVWMHPKNGAILARCAQPLVGLRNTRCKEDEKLVSGLMLRVNLDSPADTSDSNSTGSEIEETEYNSSSPDSDSSEVDGVTQFVTDVWSTFNNWNNGGNSNTISRESSLHSNDGKNDSARPAVDPASENERSTGLGDSTTSKIRLEEEFFYIVDARSQMATMGNRALGKGTENPANYTGARLLYMCIDNIHSVRGAFSKLVEIAQPSFNGDFERSLADCGWLYQVRNILVSSVKIVRHVDQHEKSVLTHCSDGWDRTAQMVSMAELLLDPWYRTRSGFAELVEKEWCGFGHKFRDRYGHGVDALSDHEFSPVFTLWIDCVW